MLFAYRYPQNGFAQDRPIERGRKISKYSLRIFLNGIGDDNFEGGLSVFHVPFDAGSCALRTVYVHLRSVFCGPFV